MKKPPWSKNWLPFSYITILTMSKKILSLVAHQNTNNGSRAYYHDCNKKSVVLLWMPRLLLPFQKKKIFQIVDIESYLSIIQIQFELLFGGCCPPTHFSMVGERRVWRLMIKLFNLVHLNGTLCNRKLRMNHSSLGRLKQRWW